MRMLPLIVTELATHRFLIASSTLQADFFNPPAFLFKGASHVVRLMEIG